MNVLYKILSKEPVLLGAALTVTADGVALIAGVSTTTQTILHGITVAWVAWGVRELSTPEAKVAQQVEAAKYVGAVEHQALASLTAGPATIHQHFAAPVKKAAKKAAAKKAPATRR